MPNAEHLPGDDREITDPYTAGDYEEATAAGRALRDRILADPRSRASSESASEEIARHQMANRRRILAPRLGPRPDAVEARDEGPPEGQKGQKGQNLGQNLPPTGANGGRHH